MLIFLTVSFISFILYFQASPDDKLFFSFLNRSIMNKVLNRSGQSGKFYTALYRDFMYGLSFRILSLAQYRFAPSALKRNFVLEDLDLGSRSFKERGRVLPLVWECKIFCVNGFSILSFGQTISGSYSPEGQGNAEKQPERLPSFCQGQRENQQRFLAYIIVI